MFPKRITLAMAFTTVLSTSVFADPVTTYTSIASFDAATKSDVDTTIDFTGLGGTDIGIDYGSSLTTGKVTFTSTNLAVYLPGVFIGTPLPSILSTNDAGTSLSINFSSPVYGFALDFGALANWGDGSLAETFSFAGTSETINLPGYLTSGAPVSFIGFTSNTAFNQITITDPTAAFVMSDLTYASNATGNPVPEPASFTLFGLGLLGLTTMRRKARKQG